ncbi:hypothetical protein CerSpe_241140 [Prunus speciosa]
MANLNDFFKNLAQLLASSSNDKAAGIAAQTESRCVAEEGGEKRRRIGGPKTSPWVGIGSAKGSQRSERNREYKMLRKETLKKTRKSVILSYADYAKFFEEILANLNAAGIAAQTESRGVAEEGGEKRRRIGGPEMSSWVRTTRRTSLSTKQENLNAQSTTVASSVEKTDQGSIARGISLLSLQNDSVSNTNDNNSGSNKNRCESFNGKVGVLGFECRCGGVFCGKHRYPETHSGNLDLKKAGRDVLAKQNPLCKGDKLQCRI